jgi:5S rRNA maturation endonuclease (ribonuclease M5)
MQNKTFKNTIQKLLSEGKVNASSIGSTVKKSSDFSTLLNARIIEYQQAKTGGGTYFVKKKDDLETYYKNKFPEELKNEMSSIDNVNAFRNTKAAKRESQNVILICGNQKIILNDIETDLQYFTGNFGTFSTVLKSLIAEKVCFVENLDSYLIAEKVIDNQFVFIHTYGGMSKSVVNKIQAKEIMIFPDYDFVGLNNYLIIKDVFPNTKLFIPKHYEELFKTKSRPIKTKQGREQQPTKRVLGSKDEFVVKIREDIFKYKQFLEQQAIFQ